MLKRKVHKVYRFKTIDQTIIYVGYTGQETVDRFAGHRRDKYWINEVAIVEECIMENEAQARNVEFMYINLLKPIFNSKDKFPGTVGSEIKPKYKKFSNAFYVLEGRPTSCIPAFGKEYTLVDFFKINGIDVGMYYDSSLNLYFSATDMCKALDIPQIKLNNILSDNFIRQKYNTINKGTERTRVAYLCNYQGAIELLNLGKEPTNTRTCRYQIEASYAATDIHVRYQNPKVVEDIKTFFLIGLGQLDGKRYESTHVNRRLAYKSLKENKHINDVVVEENAKMAMYNAKFPLEKKSADIFAMFEDFEIEFNTSYKEVITDFARYLKEKHNMNFWSKKEKLKKLHNVEDIQPHVVIAMAEDELYTPFMEYYNSVL